jgi:cytoskeletal protein CcmA (bactofilin family)
MWKPATSPSSPNANPQRPTNSGPEKTNMPISTSAPSTTPTTDSMSPMPARNFTSTNPQEQASIGKSLVIKGEVSGSESLYIDGRVEGTINLAGNRVTVGPNGVVNANVNAREIVVIGKLKGNLVASDRVDIRNEGSLTGDVIAQRISIEDGAFFKGGIDIRKPGQKGETNGKMEPTSTTAPNGQEKETVAARA